MKRIIFVALIATLMGSFCAAPIQAQTLEKIGFEEAEKFFNAGYNVVLIEDRHRLIAPRQICLGAVKALPQDGIFAIEEKQGWLPYLAAGGNIDTKKYSQQLLQNNVECMKSADPGLYAQVQTSCIDLAQQKGTVIFLDSTTRVEREMNALLKEPQSASRDQRLSFLIKERLALTAKSWPRRILSATKGLKKPKIVAFCGLGHFEGANDISLALREAGLKVARLEIVYHDNELISPPMAIAFGLLLVFLFGVFFFRSLMFLKI